MSIKLFIRGHSGLATLTLILVVVFAVVFGRVATKEKIENSASNAKQVVLVSVSSFRDDLSVVSVDGIVESASQVEIRSQVSAPIARVYAGVGDSVAAGQTIVEFQNADIRAQLEQAKANLSLAEGEYTAGGVSTDTARKNAIDKIRDSYEVADSAFYGQIAQFVFTSNPNSPDLQHYVAESNSIDKLSTQWSATEVAFSTWKAKVNSLTDNSTREQITDVIDVSQTSLRIFDTLLSTLSSALNSANRNADQTNSTLLASWKATVNGARTITNGSISALTANGSSLYASQAQIEAAEAGVKALEAQLAKTIIKAPISGKVAVLPLRVGEFASMGQLITTVVGTGGLEIKAYASSEDIDRIQKGASVKIQGTIPGTVASIAPSVNPATKKVEIKIVVSAAQKANLVVGENVQAKITALSQTAAASARSLIYLLPIQNVKIIPGSAYVFTVDSDLRIVRHEVTLGEVRGDFVEVKTGITDDMKIVSPVYELEEGQVVRTEE